MHGWRFPYLYSDLVVCDNVPSDNKNLLVKSRNLKWYI
jgi:hypothetical protein